MKLAEALILRSDYEKRIIQLKERISEYAIVQEGDVPPEDPKELIEMLDRLIFKQLKLAQKINDANCRTQFSEAETLMEAICRRDSLRRQHGLFRSIVSEAHYKPSRYSRNESRFISTVDIKELTKKADRLAKDARALDMKIQEFNWNVQFE